jgi:hypothetical protein
MFGQPEGLAAPVEAKREREFRMPAKVGAQWAFGMFIAILMTGIFPEARAEPVIPGPPTSPRGTIEIAQAGSGKATGTTVGRRDGPVIITTGLAQRLPP